jgi:hypothetical protein
LVALVLTLSLSSVAMATPVFLESVGVTIDVPDDMQIQDVSEGDEYGWLIKGNDENLLYMYILRYKEKFAGRWLEDLTYEEVNELFSRLIESLTDPQTSTCEYDGINALLLADGALSEFHHLTFLNGWLSDLAVVSKNGTELTDEQLDTGVLMLKSLQFEADSKEATDTDAIRAHK